MARTITAIFAGVLFGAFAMLLVSNFDSGNVATDGNIRDLAEVLPMTRAESVRHREERYRTLSGVAEVMALPTEFARAEALYALAGRSGSAAVRALIFEADRIVDDVARARLLGILFSRLTEIDPRSALTLARNDGVGT